MSFGLKKNFGRFCKNLNIVQKACEFPIIRANGFIYKHCEIIRDGLGRKWFITPDGCSHDEIEIETEECIMFFSSTENFYANKKALCKNTFH